MKVNYCIRLQQIFFVLKYFLMNNMWETIERIKNRKRGVKPNNKII